MSAQCPQREVGISDPAEIEFLRIAGDLPGAQARLGTCRTKNDLEQYHCPDYWIEKEAPNALRQRGGGVLECISRRAVVTLPTKKGA